MRLFVALDLPDDTAERLVAAQHGLNGARWTPQENFHVTLAFIGEADRREEDEIASALQAIDAPAFDLHIAGCGFFGDDRPRAVWAGVSPSDALSHLQAKVATALRRAGKPIESRKFKPHVTLGYVKGVSAADATAWCAAHNLMDCPPFTVGSFNLFASHLGSEAAYYEALESYPLSFSR